MYRLHNSNQKHKQWFFFDHHALLPEYILSFEYLTDGQPAVQAGAAAGALRESVAELGPIGGKESFTDQEFLDYAPFFVPLLRYAQHAAAPEAAGADETTRELRRRVAELKPALPTRPPVAAVTEELLQVRVRVCVCVGGLSV